MKNISLQHFRHFQNYSIDFHDNITVLVADNGAGKTALLDIKKGFKAAARSS